MPVSPEAFDYRLRALEEDRKKLTEAVETLVRVEMRHEETRHDLQRLESDSKGHETRVRVLEAALPELLMTSQWVKAGVLGIASLVGIQVWRLVANN